MAKLYANENFPLAVVQELPKLDHDVVTTLEAHKANQAIEDEEVLKFAASLERAVLTLNRKHVRLHQCDHLHHGIIVCTYDPDFIQQARRINDELQVIGHLSQKLIRINRPPA